MLQAKLDIPFASGIDYHDADEVCGYQLLLCKIFEKEGGLRYPPVSNRLTAAIKREGMIWLREVRQSMAELFASPIEAEGSGLRLDDMPRVLCAYDFLYRICNGAACDDFIREIVLKSADRYVKGDKSISQAQVVLMLRKEIERDIRTMENRFLTFCGTVIDGWVRDLEHSGKIRQVSDSDSYDILHFLLYSDLFAFGVKRDSKLRWIKTYTLSDEMLDTLDSITLRQYIGFEQAAEYVKGTNFDDRAARYVSLFSRLASRDDLHPYFKEGLAIDLAKYRTA